MEDPARGALGDMYKRLCLAKVSSYDVVVDSNGAQVLDAQGNTIPTGLLNVELIERQGQRTKVPFIMGLAGNTVFFGGLPEIGTMCIVGWRQQNVPVILGFLPMGIGNVINNRQVLPNMVAGEVVVQSSIPDVDVEGNDNIFRGARVWLDRYGRIKLSTTVGYEVTYGYILSNEYGPSVSYQQDPVTGGAVFVREIIKGGTERRVDDAGNTVWAYGGSKYERINKNEDVTIEGTSSKTVKQGQTLQDGNGNLVNVGPSGVTLEAGAGDVNVNAMGKLDAQIQGQLSLKSAQSAEMTAGQQNNLMSGDDTNIQAGGKLALKSTKDMTLDATTKVKLQGGGAGIVRIGDHGDAGKWVFAFTPGPAAALSITYTDPDGVVTTLAAGSGTVLAKNKNTEGSQKAESG